MKIAFITGITGQDGSYLAEFLLKKNYIVHGMKRRSSSINTSRIDHLYNEYYLKKSRFFLHYGDMTDSLSLKYLIDKIKPDEIYNLAAQSHVAVSFEIPEYTANADAIGTLRILEIIKSSKKKIKFYQAGTSELYGKVLETPQNENTPFYPRSPYGVAKLYAHWITKNYREAYNIFACNGILFNHESPRRGETFVTKKITLALTRIAKGYNEKLEIGNIYAKRDWGHAEDYSRAMWLMMQQKKPDDFVISTGIQYSVKEFIEECAKVLKIKIKWKGKGLNEKGYDSKGKCIVKINKRYFRKAEVESLLGSSKKAFKILKWKPKINFKELVREMTNYDLKNLSK